MTTQQPNLRWLSACRTEITATPEWEHVKGELLRRLQAEVETRGIEHLSALSEEEKLQLLLQV